jgi:uncharacterized protein (TIGR03382 family)
MRVPESLAGPRVFRVWTMSERPIEVRNVSLRAAGWETPVSALGPLPQGQAVYRMVAELPPLHDGDEPVAIYENLLCVNQAVRGRGAVRRGPEEASIERLRWISGRNQADFELAARPPEVSLEHFGSPSVLLACTTGPAVAFLAVVSLAAWILWHRRRRAGRQRTP